MITSPTAADLRVALADQLAQQGFLTDPGWRDTFAAVPRDAFVPFYFEPCRGRPGWRLVEGGQHWVISTVALPCVPPAWLEQAREGARILIPLSFAGHGGLMALLSRDATGGASGRFLPQYGGFMAVRSEPEPAAPKIRTHPLETVRPTNVPPEALNNGHPAACYLSLRCPWPYKVIQFTPDDDSASVHTWGQSTDGSTFALIHANGVTQAAAIGPLWDALEAAYTQWHELGRPERNRFGVTAGKRQSVWLDEPDHVITELRAPVAIETNESA